MQDRLKEIQERLNGYSVVLKKDMMFLLAALEEAQDKNKQQIEIKNNLATLYCQSQDRERQLQAKNHDLELSIAAVRAANDAWKKLVHELQLEIIKPKNQEV